jgi:hypothetical protein
VNLSEFEENAITDRLEGWELVEFLQIPVGHILLACLENDWINEDNYADVLELVGVKQ